MKIILSFIVSTGLVSIGFASDLRVHSTANSGDTAAYQVIHDSTEGLNFYRAGLAHAMRVSAMRSGGYFLEFFQYYQLNDWVSFSANLSQGIAGFWRRQKDLDDGYGIDETTIYPLKGYKSPRSFFLGVEVNPIRFTSRAKKNTVLKESGNTTTYTKVPLERMTRIGLRGALEGGRAHLDIERGSGVTGVDASGTKYPIYDLQSQDAGTMMRYTTFRPGIQVSTLTNFEGRFQDFGTVRHKRMLSFYFDFISQFRTKLDDIRTPVEYAETFDGYQLIVKDLDINEGFPKFASGWAFGVQTISSSLSKDYYSSVIMEFGTTPGFSGTERAFFNVAYRYCFGTNPVPKK